MTDQEIIQRVATEVMGWVKVLHNDIPGWAHGGDYDWIMVQGTFDPLTNLNHTFMVVEKMREDRFDCTFNSNTFIGNWSARFFKYYAPEYVSEQEFHNSLGHAICLAALKAKEVQHD